jgi:very-short-patch-repair endonuclease
MRTTSNARTRARRLRKEMSLPEVLLWQGLRQSRAQGVAFRRQHPIGPYVLDFYCARARLCVEVDGASHGFGGQPAQDARRDRFFFEMGIETVRVAASDVLEDPYAVAVRLIERAQCDGSAPSTTSWSPSPVAPATGEDLATLR